MSIYQWSTSSSCSQISPRIPCVCYSHVLSSVSEHFHAHHRNYHLEVYGTCFSAWLCFICFSCYGCQVTPYPHLYVIQLQFHFLSKIPWHPFSIQSKVPQQFIVLVCKSSYKAGDKKKLSMYSMFNPCSTSCYSCICSCHWKSHTLPVSA